MVSCKEALQQLQEAQQNQHSIRQTDTPMQLMQQYHPVEAAAFRQATNSREERMPKGSIDGGVKYIVKGFVESADEEASKRLGMMKEATKSIRSQYTQHDEERIGHLHWWHHRAQETLAMAQQFELAATDAMSALETAFSNQEWDHRTMIKLHDSKLAAIETALETAQDEFQAMDGSEDIVRRREAWHTISLKCARNEGSVAGEVRAGELGASIQDTEVHVQD